MNIDKIDFDQIIPNLAQEGTWVGKCMVPSSLAYKGIEGPHVVQVKKGKVYDLSNIIIQQVNYSIWLML